MPCKSPRVKSFRSNSREQNIDLTLSRGPGSSVGASAREVDRVEDQPSKPEVARKAKETEAVSRY